MISPFRFAPHPDRSKAAITKSGNMRIARFPLCAFIQPPPMFEMPAVRTPSSFCGLHSYFINSFSESRHPKSHQKVWDSDFLFRRCGIKCGILDSYAENPDKALPIAPCYVVFNRLCIHRRKSREHVCDLWRCSSTTVLSYTYMRKKPVKRFGKSELALLAENLWPIYNPVI